MSLLTCVRCPQCSAVLSSLCEPPTLVLVECPFDSNDMLHWECAHCGHSDLPNDFATSYFAGNPTPLEGSPFVVAEKKRQRTLFNDEDE